MTKRIDNLCGTHRDNPEPGHRCKTCARIRGEMRVVKKTAETCIKAGYHVLVHDGEEIALKPSQDVAAIMKAVFSTDEDRFYLYKNKDDKGHSGAIWFVYGNDPSEVICDYHTRLEEVLKPVIAYAEKQSLYA